jgi:hypothetical protein
MKRVLLITSKNSLYRDELIKGGYTVTEYTLPLNQERLFEIEHFPLCSFSIVEAMPENIDTDRKLYPLLRKKGNVICLSEIIAGDQKRHLLDCGISDVMKNHADHFLQVLKSIDEESRENAGTFVVLNDDDAVKNVLMNIINRFRYQALFVPTVDELFKAMGDYGVRFMLINLGTKNIDLNGLVRKFYASQVAHNIPVLAFKDMREGLFVHELVGGLNRLTRYILSLDELYSLLVDMLFRREIIPLVTSLKRLSDFESNACYDAETISQAFFSCEKTIFNQKNLLDDDTLSSIKNTVRQLNTVLLKTESLKWLKVEIDRKDISIAGRGGSDGGRG